LRDDAGLGGDGPGIPIHDQARFMDKRGGQPASTGAFWKCARGIRKSDRFLLRDLAGRRLAEKETSDPDQSTPESIAYINNWYAAINDDSDPNHMQSGRLSFHGGGRRDSAHRESDTARSCGPAGKRCT
jgi:hypothetical protein